MWRIYAVSHRMCVGEKVGEEIKPYHKMYAFHGGGVFPFDFRLPIYPSSNPIRTIFKK